MEEPKKVTLFFLLAVGQIIFAIPSMGYAKEPMQVTVGEDIVLVHAGPNVLLRYRYEDVPFKPYADQFFSPQGVNVLRDAPVDHKHHHGLMFAVAVDGVNFWEEHKAPGCQAHRSFNDVKVGGESGGLPWAAFTQDIDWINPRSQELLLDERRTIELCRLKDAKAVLLTWQSSFDVPSHKESVTLTGSHYFGLGMRFVKSMDTGGQFRNADGKTGNIVRGSERLVRSRWCAYTARADGKSVTIAMFDYPQNRRPVTWFTMTKPFAYLSATLNLHKQPLKMMSDKPLVLRYGVALWDSQAESDQIEQLYQQWVVWPCERQQHSIMR
ncbi:MAG: DUF6807 family protein [Sedimentisphaerales bacterium]